MQQSTEPDLESTDLLPRMRSYVEEHEMLSPGSGVVVAVSGGPDSIVMLDLLCRLEEELRITVHVAHLNHRLRGAESDGDADFVARLADDLGLICSVGTADVGPVARREKRSLEEAARVARHGFLEGVRRNTGSARIALGHTRSDQAETLLLRLMRGSGRRGLGAIRPVREGVWIRPLLSVSRSDVEAYVSYRGLEVRHDRSNTDIRFLRNRVRRDLLPHLEAEYGPGIEGVLARTADILQQEEDLLSQHTESALQSALTYSAERKIVLDTQRVIGYHIAIQRRLLRAAMSLLDRERQADDFGSVQGLLRLLSSDSGGVQVAPDISAHRSGERLILSRQTPPFHVRLCVPGHTEIPSLDAAVDVRVRPAQELRQNLRDLGPCRACFDRAALTGELTVRSRRPGDRIRPFGMPGSRKVSDLLIDGKIPKPLRDEVPVLVSGDSIVWVVGLRTAQPFCVSDRTAEVVEVEFKGGWICSEEAEPTRKR